MHYICAIYIILIYITFVSYIQPQRPPLLALQVVREAYEAAVGLRDALLLLRDRLL